MLQLKDITKHYPLGDSIVEALKEVSLTFRKSEFVAILGPSGCGKTTMLNIIGGLDRYTSGDLLVNGVSTKEYKDVDWDIYRNNSIGFVFQNYNLISHQSVLANVELAMTLAGISKAERKARAIDALTKVGLDDQIHKKPNQLSGGQMQRVAIARALVNNPDILLADEPTGALDSEASVQIMEILKEVSKERLVIMVTHNPELADTYSTRIIRLLDGRVTDDSNPYTPETDSLPKRAKKKKKISMSFFTALSLSLTNLMTKKTRTILTSFAGSIGIIGIALILSLSSGMQAYIQNMQEDTLSTYPLQITGQTIDLTSMMTSMMQTNRKKKDPAELDKVYTNSIVTDMMKAMSAQVINNDLKQLKSYLESKDGAKIRDLANDIQYGYNLDLQIYSANTQDGILKVHPSDIFNQLMGGAQYGGPSGGSMGPRGGMTMMGSNVWTEMIGNQALLEKQYDVLAGRWPTSYDEVVLIVNNNNELSDIVLYSLGLLDQAELQKMIERMQKGEDVSDLGPAGETFSYDELLHLTFKLVLNTDYFTKENNTWVDNRENDIAMASIIEDTLDIRVVGILRPNPEVTATSINSTVAYTPELTRYVIDQVNTSAIVAEQKANPDVNVLTGLPFDMEDFTKNLTMEDVLAYMQTMPEAERKQLEDAMAVLPEEQILAIFAQRMKEDKGLPTSYEDMLTFLGVVDLENPSSINIYPVDYEGKETIADYIDEYNTMQRNAGHEEYVITYTDIMGIMMGSVTKVVDIITYVLIAFVSISLVVSSLMIGIITYISVLERTREIGILRSIGASKRDISRVFNAETVIIGFVAGLMGILITVLLNIPINMVLKSLANVSNIASLPVYGAISLILISVTLTVIAGLLPSRMAAKKDPVEALRFD
jgi:putative ABC transport system permease protein